MEKIFPDIHVSNKHLFKDFLYREHSNTLRIEIRRHILNGNESDFYDLDAFNRKHVKNMTQTHEMVKEIREELHRLGWKTDLGFGDTGLYIYSTEEKPFQGNFF